MSSPEPIQSPVGALEAARRESQQAAYKQLSATLKELDRLDVPVLDDSLLQALGIRKLPDIDVDEHAPFDPEPLFFRPYPLDEEENLPEFVNDALQEGWYDTDLQWKKPCTKSYCPGALISHGRHCSCGRYLWAKSMAGQFDDGIMGKTKWRYTSALSDDRDMYLEEDISHSFTRSRGRGRDRGWKLLGTYGTPGFYMQFSTFDELDMSKPHIGVAVCDSSTSSVATLASEVAAAITVLKFRYRRGEFVDFHTIPIIIYSFHHDESARITQAHWDDKGLVIRHSRLLDLRGDEPTRDAYLLIRWMANKPVGETAYHAMQETNSLGNGEKPRPDCATRWDISVGA